VGYVVVELGQGAASVLLRVFDLAAELGWSAAYEDHFVFRWRQAPFGISGGHVCASEVVVLVAGVAAHGYGAVSVGAALDVLDVDVAVVALERSVARGMAVGAAGRG
jgi:hypothetical protein